MSRLELFKQRDRRAPVPWADFLADIAAGHIAVQLVGEQRINVAAMLDRQVADATRRIELARRDDRTCRAGIKAAMTCAAPVNGRRVGRPPAAGRVSPFAMLARARGAGPAAAPPRGRNVPPSLPARGCGVRRARASVARLEPAALSGVLLSR